jgi:hypothetical protein
VEEIAWRQVTVTFNFGIDLQFGEANRQPIDDALKHHGYHFSGLVGSQSSRF